MMKIYWDLPSTLKEVICHYFHRYQSKRILMQLLTLSLMSF
ncbi:hypothetical protein MGAS10270_Spy1279 [Streptococcus pyogenes MGAS10270]|nr:hypothetical protein MGAS10270_Spy1279 [Streptococcus pyogenes MGAS10270]